MAQADQNLYAYIKPLVEQGVPENTIRETLSAQGWPEDVVGATFESLKASAQLPPPPPPPQKFSNPFIPPETTPASEQDTRPMLRVPVYSALLGVVLAMSMFVLSNKAITDLSNKLSGQASSKNVQELIEVKQQECNKIYDQITNANNDKYRCTSTLDILRRTTPEEEALYQQQKIRCSEADEIARNKQAASWTCNTELSTLERERYTGVQHTGDLSVRLFVTGAMVLIFWVVTLSLHQLFKDSGRQFLVLTAPYYLVSIGLFLRLVVDVFRYLLNEAAGWGIYAVLILGIGLLSLTVILIQKYKKQLI